MLNRIDENTPELAVVTRLRRLEQSMREFQNQVQAPTVLATASTSVSLPLWDTFAAAGGLPDINLIATLSSPGTSNRIMALPEFSIFHGTGAPADEVPGVSLGGSQRVFPEGTLFLAYGDLPAWYRALHPDPGFGADMLDVNWWYDLHYSSIASGGEVAHLRLRLDAAMQNQVFPGGQTAPDWAGETFTIYQRWRYLSAGAVTS